MIIGNVLPMTSVSATAPTADPEREHQLAAQAGLVVRTAEPLNCETPAPLLGEDVTRWTQSRRARHGLGRSYQRNTIFPGLTVFENCRLAAQARTQRPWDWWGAAAACKASVDAARTVAARTGLDTLLERDAGLLSHGQKRQLEIAMCLATAPDVLLLGRALVHRRLRGARCSSEICAGS